MPRPFLPDEVVRIVEMTWAEDPGQSAATVHRILDHEHGEGYVSLSKVQQIVRKTKQSGVESSIRPAGYPGILLSVQQMISPTSSASTGYV